MLYNKWLCYSGIMELFLKRSYSDSDNGDDNYNKPSKGSD